MNQAFNRLFWGYLFVLFEIHIIVIDILADPVGYYFIFSGITMLFKDFLIAHKARKLSFSLIFLSIPSVFIQQNVGTNQLEQLPFLSGLSLYTTVLDLVNFILVFYIFQLIMTIVHQHVDGELIRRSSRTFSLYIIVKLLATIASPFAMNLSGDGLLWIVLITIFISFIIEIVFLVLLWSLRKVRWKS